MEINGKTAYRTLNVLFAAAEADPFIKIGGLGDVAGSLPNAISYLSTKKHTFPSVDIRLVLPFYPQLKAREIPSDLITTFTIKSTDGLLQAEVFSTNFSGITTYLVSGDPIIRSQMVYSSDFRLDAEKFIFFSLACLLLPHALGWKVDILHLNDWHTAIAAHVLKKTVLKPRELKHTRTILTIHNLPFMGAGAEPGLAKFRVKPATNKDLPKWGRRLPLPMGLAAADQIIAVSPKYSKEILTSKYGCDLQNFLATRQSHISGILNGIDTQHWNPATDPHITENYDSQNLQKKKINKVAILKEFNFKQKVKIPLLILVSRMDPQKGVDIAIEALKLIKDVPWQAILLGTGDPNLENACKALVELLPEKVRALMQFDSKLSRRLYAGADILMMPSRYEPCGISQMIAMRYGCIPVASATGGLVDTIQDAENNDNATGFLSPEANSQSFSHTLLRAIETYQNQDQWHQLMISAMAQDFSWDRSAQQYIERYTSLAHGYIKKR